MTIPIQSVAHVAQILEEGSPTIDAIAHESGGLRVRLTKGRIYEYDSVPESVFMLTTDDPDTYYGLNVRGEYHQSPRDLRLRAPN